MVLHVVQNIPFASLRKKLLSFICDVCILLDIDLPAVKFVDDYDPSDNPEEAAVYYVVETNTLILRTACLTKENYGLIQFAIVRELCMAMQYQQHLKEFGPEPVPDDPWLFWCEEAFADGFAVAVMDYLYGADTWDHYGILEIKESLWYDFAYFVELAANELEKMISTDNDYCFHPPPLLW